MGKYERRKWLTAYAPLVIWIGVILFLGSSQGSMNRTSLIIRPLLEFIFPAASPETITFYHGIVRKFAHFGEYAILALLSLRAFVRTSLPRLRAYCYIAALVLVVAVAIVDETLQSFDVSRTSSSWDVLLDVSGGVFLLLVARLSTRSIRTRQEQP